MNIENCFVADIETKGLLGKLQDENDFHVLSVGFKNKEGKWEVKSTNKREDVEKVFCNPSNVIVMHNGRRYDVPAIEKMFKIKVTAIVIDSLALSWWLYPTRSKEGKKFGLEAFGEDFGVPKPKIDPSEWEGIGRDKEEIIKYYERGFNK